MEPELGPPAKERNHLHYITASTEADKLHGQVLAQIDRLPSELLTHIFQLCIRASLIAFPDCDLHRHLKRRLASVSRRWRDIILNSAKFWTTIKLAPTWSESLVKAHLARSSECSLDIEMCGPWPHGTCAAVTHALLDLLISCSYRWRSVVVRHMVPDDQLVELLSRMEHKTFPSLTHLSLECTSDWLCDDLVSWLCTEHFPRLEHLGLAGPLDPSLAGRVPPNLTSLVLGLDDQGPSSIIQHLSLQKLTSLTLSGRAVSLRLDPSSIQLPLLEKFMCKARDGHVLIHAIVAPNLLHLEYTPFQFVGLAYDRWNPHTPRYPNVTDLVLPLCGIRGPSEMAGFHFPAIRRVTLHRYGISSLFGRKDVPYGAMYWSDLETLTIEDLDYDIYDSSAISERVDLVAWLKRRQRMGRSNLLVKLEFSRHVDKLGDVSDLCIALHRYCTLEVAGIHLDPTADVIIGEKLSVCVFPSFHLHVKVYVE